MNFQECLRKGKAKKVMPSASRAASLSISSAHAITTAQTIPLTLVSAKTILRELYEGLRECLEAIGYESGYKFLDHESIGFFVRDMLLDQESYAVFDRYRRLRNKINYLGEDIEPTTVREAISEIPSRTKDLEREHAT